MVIIINHKQTRIRVRAVVIIKKLIDKMHDFLNESAVESRRKNL